MRIGIIGPESSGKSTLAAQLAKERGGRLVTEYARDYVAQKGTTEVTWDELCQIARHQINEMERLGVSGLAVSELVFFDTELIVTKVWFEYAFGRVPEWLEEAIRKYPMDEYYLCLPDIPWIADPTRSNGSDEIRWELYRRYEHEIQQLGIPYRVIRHTC